MTAPEKRAITFEVAKKVIELLGQGVGQAKIGKELKICQTRVSQIKTINSKCCPQAFQAWNTGKITTESAGDLSKVSFEQQVERLNTLTAGNRKEWTLELARQAGRNKRPHLNELRSLITDLQKAEDLDADKVEVAIAALRHSAGDLTREELLEKLK